MDRTRASFPGQCNKHQQEQVPDILGHGDGGTRNDQLFHICFLVAGHTKFTPDRLFATCSKMHNKSDVFNEGELGKLYSQHSQVNVSNSDGIHPWREALKASYSDIPGIRKFHKFLIVRMGNKVSLRVEERCYNPMMIQSSLSKSNILSNLKYQSYKESAKPLSYTKVGHIQQMCEQFIPSS
jgi:hypothetical protein